MSSAKNLNIEFNKKSYPKRFTVERTFGWEDTYRSLVIRYDRKSSNYRGEEAACVYADQPEMVLWKLEMSSE